MGLKVLLVDDDEMIMFLHKTVTEISSLAYDPVCLGNGKEALNYLDKEVISENIFLVLLDINMPVMDGWGFLEAIQSKPYAASVMVIVASSSIDNLDRERALQYKQVIEFVEKPLNLEICERIKQMPSVIKYF